MVRIELAPEVLTDFDRSYDHLAQLDVAQALDRIAQIVQALEVLARSPPIGRPVKGGKRELVIGRGTRRYVALYRFIAEIDTVFVLAVRHQRESGHERERRTVTPSA